MGLIGRGTGHLPGKTSTLSPEVKGRPSLYQVRVGGGAALVSQCSNKGLFRSTSLASPALPVPSMFPISQSFWKLGGTVEGEGVFAHTGLPWSYH